MNPINPIEIKKDNAEVVSTTADKNAEAKVLASSLHDEKNIETDIAVNKEKWKVSLLWVNSIENGITNKDATNFENSVDKKDTKKSFTEKAGDWVREHKNLVWRGAWIWASLLVYNLFKGRRKKKEAKEAKAGKEPGFLKKTRRTLLGIGATLGWWRAAYKIAMWMIDWSKDPNEAKTDDFKKLQEKDPVSAEKYTQLWDATDKTYEAIFQKELDAWWQDDADMAEVSERATGGKEALKWVVPYMLDEKYSSVNDLLSYHGEYMSIVNDSIENISSRIQWLVTWSFGFLKDKFFWLFMKSGEDKKMSFVERINKDSKQHAQELKFFVREWVRLQTFLLEKEHHLVEKIAQQKLSLSGGYEDVQEAMKDNEWMSKNVYNDPRLAAFRKWKIKGAFDILNKEWLLNADLTADTKDIIKDLDEDRDEIIWFNWKTSDLEQIKNDLADDGKIEQASHQNLYKISQAIVKDMDDELLDAMQTTCLSPFADLLNMDDAAKRDFMQKTGMLQCFNDIKMWFADFSTKLAWWELSPDQIKSFIHTVNTYTAWKKEVFIGATTIQQVKANKDGIVDWSVAIWWTWLELLKNTYKGIQGMYNGNFGLNNFGYLFFGWISIYAAGGLLYLVNPKIAKWVQIAGKYIAIAWSLPVSVPYKIVSHSSFARKFRGVYRWPKWAIRRMYFEGEKWAVSLWREFEAGRISLRDASWIIENWQWASKKISEAWYKEFPDSDNIKRRLIEKKWGTDLTKFGQLDSKKAQIIAEYYDVGNMKDKLRSNFAWTVADLEKIELAKTNLSWSKLELFNKIRNQKGIDVTKMEDMIKKIQQLDESLLQWKNLDDIANKLVKNPDAWKDPLSLEIAVKKINAGKVAPAVDEIHNIERKTFDNWLTWNKKTLFDRTAQEIESLTNEAQSLMAKDKKVARAVAEESRRLKDFAKQIKTLNPTEAWEVLKILGRTNWLRLSLRTFVYLWDNAKDIKVILSEIHASSAAGTLTEDVLKWILAKDADLLKTLQKAWKYDEVVIECMKFGKSVKSVKAVTAGVEILAKFLKTVR